MMRTRIEPATAALLNAVEYLRAGELVAFPTETVYGLGADARRDDAVRAIYAAKGRPSGNPLIVHVADLAAAKACAAHWPNLADRLAKQFWPGPLTLIVPRGEGLSPLVSAGRHTVALRCPKHPVAEALLCVFNGPIAAPSANRSGFTSPTTAQHVMAELSGRVPLILDGGACDIGLESTVLDISGDVPTVLRPGAITLEQLRAAIGDVQMIVHTVSPEESAASPGMHDRHYAPHTPAYRFGRGQWNAARALAERQGPVGLLSFAEDIFLPAPHETVRMPGEELAYARTLYAALREIDQRGLAALLVLMPERHEGVWVAVVDRLRRATRELPE